VEYTYIPNAFFGILYTSLTMMLIYFMYKNLLLQSQSCYKHIWQSQKWFFCQILLI